MKKPLLLLVSALLIICMAGSAMATSTVVIPSNQITVYPNSEGSVTLQLKDFTSGPYTLRLSVRDANLEATIVDPSNLLALGPATVGSYAEKSVNLDSNLHEATINVKRFAGTQVGSVTVTVFDASGNAVSSDQTFVSGETIKVNAPEFPTIAAPIAGIIGLLFIVGRKKEGL